MSSAGLPISRSRGVDIHTLSSLTRLRNNNNRRLTRTGGLFVLTSLSCPCGRLMADRDSGAAQRRRQRRLRSWWRHEQQSIAAVLATVTHHSHSKVGTVNAALRGQKTGTSTRVGPAEYYELSSNDGRPTGGERPRTTAHSA